MNSKKERIWAMMEPTPVITRAPRRRRYGRSRLPHIAWITGIIIAAAVLLVAGIAAFAGWKITHPQALKLDDSPKEYGLRYEDVQFTSRNDTILLKGWFLPGTLRADAPPVGDNPINVIVVHSYKTNRINKEAGALPLAQELVGKGYNVLLFDLRNSGESEGTVSSFGIEEQQDVLGAVDWIRQNHPGPVVLLGSSIGATTALMAAAQEPAITAVIADSPFITATDFVKANVSNWSDLPDVPFRPLTMLLLPKMAGVDLAQGDGVAAVEHIYPRPILFIHSTEDTQAPYLHSEQLWQKHTDRFQIWKTTGSGHAKSYLFQPEAYTRQVFRFLESL